METRRRLLSCGIFVVAGAILYGCGPRSQVIESPPLAELTDEQIRAMLTATIDSGDASSDLYLNLVRQLSQGGAANREDASALRRMVEEMIVQNDPEKNRAFAKKILEKW